MKKILILAEKQSENKQKLVGYLTQSFVGRAEVTLGKFSDLSFEIGTNKIRVKIINEEINNYSLVVFRSVPKKVLPVAEALAVALDFLKIKYLDGAYGKIGLTHSKLASIIKFSLAGLPAMPSFFCWWDKIKEKREDIVSKFGFPLVAKKTTGQLGEGVFLLRSKKDFDFLKQTDPNDQFLFQSFYPSDEEYRLLVLGDRVRVWERKSRTNKTEFRQNVAQGAKEEFLEINQLPNEMAEIALKAAKVVNYEIAGVDILVDKTGRIWLLEVNREPALTYNAKVSPELKEITSYFAGEAGIEK